MTELKTFLTSLYDALSEAEMQALQHGQLRLAELLESGTVPEDVAVPVYHATDVEVTLDVGLRAERTEEGVEMFVTDDDDASALTFTVDLLELLERHDLEDLDYDRIVSGGGTGASPGGKEGNHGRDERETGTEDEPDDADETEGTDGSGGRSSGGPPSRIPPVDVIDGIGPRYRERLASAGIGTLTDLVDRSPEEVAETVGDEEDVSPERAADWLDEARGLTAVLADHEEALPVELVDGIGPTFGSRLREHGIVELSALVDLTPEELSALASTESSTVSPDRAAEWLDRAEARLRALGDRGDDEETNGNGTGTETNDDTTETDE